MRFVSTRGGAPAVSAAGAIRRGVAPDGGLYIPAAAVRIDPAGIAGATLAAKALGILEPFFEDDPLQGALKAICAETFSIPVPLLGFDPASPDLRLLELFHGPTGAFKDFGARFLMACFDRLREESGPLTILVATSGDTGGAVACAAEGRKGVRSVTLFPRGRVSPFQRRQLSCWAPPSLSLEVDGDFDDCQRLVKAAFADPGLSAAHRLISANSINVGRLLPQMANIGAAALSLFRETGFAPGFVIPTGNLGHALAALWARRLGLPVGPVVAATNANRSLLDWSRTGRFRPAPAVRTVANAMDVGAPSNFERLLRIPRKARKLHVASIGDDAIRRRIRKDYRRSGYVLCPHTAVAVEAYHRIDPAIRSQRPWIVTATAHPGKFAEVVGPLVGEPVPPPPGLEAVLRRRERVTPIPATLAALAEALESRPGGELAHDDEMEAAA